MPQDSAETLMEHLSNLISKQNDPVNGPSIDEQIARFHRQEAELRNLVQELAASREEERKQIDAISESCQQQVAAIERLLEQTDELISMNLKSSREYGTSKLIAGRGKRSRRASLGLYISFAEPPPLRNRPMIREACFEHLLYNISRRLQQSRHQA
ncbi:uncharacterized protein BP5553_06242 [Venustampulla echinocandica]|uniref:Uncharacterized protein n=1 Tax=Venustampulla echinocandica TaxID=2656787 RepID=A0A370TMY0_9HELO|nr:uncharacterized protein BP5553_06242 [Venustampulla echinocandica]RDL36890.1 hypothetical protein BP5553_06242 [Venustampulla echinocandica]